MFAEEIRRAIAPSPTSGLAGLSAALWRGFAAGTIGEDDAQQLAEMIAARRAVPTSSERMRQDRRTGSRPRSSASLERRRGWVAGGWLPPALAARFTMGEAAALAVIVREIATAGRCGLPMGGGALAGRGFALRPCGTPSARPGGSACYMSRNAGCR